MLVAACSGGDGAGTVNGTLQGLSFSVGDAISLTRNGHEIAITDYGGACTTANSVKANSNVLVFFFAATAFATGTYAVGGNGGVSVQYAHYDATCNSPNGESATSGSVVITGITDSGVSGTFDVTFATDHITGTFDASTCTPPGTQQGCL
jgi:hypothetical protein